MHRERLEEIGTREADGVERHTLAQRGALRSADALLPPAVHTAHRLPPTHLLAVAAAAAGDEPPPKVRHPQHISRRLREDPAA